MKLYGTALLGSPGIWDCPTPAPPLRRPRRAGAVPRGSPSRPRSTFTSAQRAGCGHLGVGCGALAGAAARVPRRLQKGEGQARWAWPLLLLRLCGRLLPGSAGTRLSRSATVLPVPRESTRVAGRGLRGRAGARDHGGGPLMGRGRLHEAEEREAAELGHRAPLLQAQLVVLPGSKEEPQLRVAGTASPGPAGRPVPEHLR